jgi:predicted helicase
MLADLEASALEWPDSVDGLRPARMKPWTPRPHQKEALAAGITGLKDHNRGKVVMACGTGKTNVGLYLSAQRITSTPTVFKVTSGFWI